MIKELVDVTNELQNAIKDDKTYPDADVVMKSLKDVDEYLMRDEPNIHEIYYGDGELLKMMFRCIAMKAKSLLYSSLKWMDVHDYLSSLDAKLKKIFKDTEYETEYAKYSIHFAGGGSWQSIHPGVSSGGGIAFPECLVMPPPVDHEKIREHITANMRLFEFFELCDFIVDIPCEKQSGKEILDAFVKDLTNKVKLGERLVGPDHVKDVLNIWKIRKQELEKSTKY